MTLVAFWVVMTMNMLYLLYAIPLLVLSAWDFIIEVRERSKRRLERDI